MNDAIDRLREKAQNEATCIALSDLLRLARDDVRRLTAENTELHALQSASVSEQKGDV